MKIYIGKSLELEFHKEGPGNKFPWPANNKTWSILIMGFIFWGWIIYEMIQFFAS